MTLAAHTLDRLFRVESGPVLATLIRLLGDIQLAEDALQDAFTSAVETWCADGLPPSPGAWLATTARRKALDRMRHLRVVEAKHSELALSLRLGRDAYPAPDDVDVLPVPDDQLRLIFTCCHPALSLEAQVALTLRTLGGLSIGEIAHAFLASEATIGQRITRAKQKIARAGIPYEVPDRESLPSRLDAVLNVLYLVFNEGYLASSEERLIRSELVDDALRLSRALCDLLPEEPEPMGLFGLMLLHDSRREARVSDAGDLVLLGDQDRTKWNRAQITAGAELVERALRMRRPGRYQIQGAIAAVHAESPSAAETDWHQIAILYEQLLRRERSPVIEVNRAVAVSFAVDARKGLELLAVIERGAVEEYAPYHLARADMLRRLGRQSEARACYERALPFAQNAQVRRFIERAQCRTSEAPDEHS